MQSIEPRQRKQLLAVLQTGQCDAMSSDEEMGSTADGDRRFRIRQVTWRSKEFGEFLRRLDVMRRESRFDMRGSGFRIRWHSENRSQRHAPSGLPEACYSPAWLKERSAVERAILAPVSTPVDFDISYVSTAVRSA